MPSGMPKRPRCAKACAAILDDMLYPWPQRRFLSVVVASLKKIDSILADPVNKPVFLCNPPRPATRQHELQRFGLPDTRKRIPHRRFHKLQNAECGLAVSSYPIAQVFAKLRMKHRLALNGPCQVPSPGAAFQATPACLYPVWPFAGPLAAAGHSWVSAANERSPSGLKAPLPEPAPRPWRHAAARLRLPDHWQPGPGPRPVALLNS